MYDGRSISEQCSCKTLKSCILLSLGVLIWNEKSKRDDKITITGPNQWNNRCHVKESNLMIGYIDKY